MGGSLRVVGSRAGDGAGGVRAAGAPEVASEDGRDFPHQAGGKEDAEGAAGGKNELLRPGAKPRAMFARGERVLSAAGVPRSVRAIAPPLRRAGGAHRGGSAGVGAFTETKAEILMKTYRRLKLLCVGMGMLAGWPLASPGLENDGPAQGAVAVAPETAVKIAKAPLKEWSVVHIRIPQKSDLDAAYVDLKGPAGRT